MRRQVRELERRLAAWVSCRASSMRSDDQGAVSTETVIVTAIIGAAAVALGLFVSGNILDWQGEIPTP